MGIVITEQRLVPAWMAAVRHLEESGRRCRNIMLEIAEPANVTAADRAVVTKVDSLLRAHSDLSVSTVAGTIFPQGLYLRTGAEMLAERYFKVMKRAQKPNTWGTYAMRLMRRRGREAGTTFNPLEQVVSKLRRASTHGKPYESNYELGTIPVEDLDGPPVDSCEIPLFDAATDGAKVANIPCLSHLSFKLTDRATVDLTAIYRSHYYAARTLGNLVGLAHLLEFVAKEANLQPGMLTCISTHAVLDLQAWGGVTAGQAVVASLSACVVAPT